MDLGSGDKSDDDSRSNALTPASTSSFGHSVMSKKGKTGYDVQKNLSGLMLNSQSSAKTKQPFAPPAQKRKIEEDSLEDDLLFNMYTAVKIRPMSSVIRKGSSTVGHGNKRSKFKNPFKVGSRGTESKEKGETSR